MDNPNVTIIVSKKPVKYIDGIDWKRIQEDTRKKNKNEKNI